MKEILNYLKEDLEIFMDYQNTIHLTNIRTTFQEDNKKKYLSSRDSKHTVKEMQWVILSLEYTARCWKMKEVPISIRASNNRMIFNKVWQPCNIHRYDKGKMLK